MPYPEIVVAGCGNLLFADDGFGPAVAQELLKFALPDNVKVVDAGICAAPFVFTLLDSERTKKLIIVDIVDFDAVSGAIARQHPRCPSRGHRRSTPRIEDGIDVTIIGCQPKRLPGPEMEIGLSEEVRKAVPGAVRIVLDIIGALDD
ncbi:hydrogenase maturation protease [Methanoculleus bourgensis]|jgi:coenzyme F420 hydrogenase subunit delta|nr:hydrogenase maturation protease [Methanoculleus bourgensis]